MSLSEFMFQVVFVNSQGKDQIDDGKGQRLRKSFVSVKSELTVNCIFQCWLLHIPVLSYNNGHMAMTFLKLI